MSPAIEPGVASDDDFAEAALPLLQATGEKLQEVIRHAKDLARGTGSAKDKSAPPDRDELLSRFRYLRPPAEELARQVSAVVEQGRLGGLRKVKLWFALADYEHLLAFATSAIDRVPLTTDEVPRDRPGRVLRKYE